MADGITADFLILADAAQVQGEKLYMLGGGWSLIWAKEFPAQHQMAVAAGILVPWLETNARHQFRIVVHARGRRRVRRGRAASSSRAAPPGLPAGTTQRVMLTVNMTIRHRAAVRSSGGTLARRRAGAKSVPFRIVQRPR